MFSFRKSLVLSFLIFVIGAHVAHACTCIIVTRGATKNGSVIISYSCDGRGYMPHLRITPAADHKPGDVVKITNYYGVKGEIPQIPHTYKVIGLMNENQVSIVESTFDGRLELVDKTGLLHYPQLIHLGLYRSKTAREAIEVMTSLAEEFGYASSGESITVADKNEAWILEMIGMGEGKKGVVWVAMRIPDGTVSAHANMSRIREFPLDDPENCLYSDNVISFAVEQGFYDPDSGKPFSFSEAYCPPSEEQIRYSARRIWSIFSRVAPSAGISSNYSSNKPGTKPYPLTIVPDDKLDVRDVIALHRDHYEGTAFDMTRDVTAGPFGSPDRWRPMLFEVDGQSYSWERPIATYNAGFVSVSEIRPDLPDEIGGIFWFGLDNAYSNFFIPLYTSITEMPTSFSVGSTRKFSRDSGWWAFNFVATFAQLRYSYMIQDIQKVQKEIEDQEFALQGAVESAAMHLYKTNPEMIAPYLTQYCVKNAEDNIQKWWDLSEFLITKYNDGYILDEEGRHKEIGYPVEWLRREIRENGKRMKLLEKRKGEGDL